MGNTQTIPLAQELKAGKPWIYKVEGLTENKQLMLICATPTYPVEIDIKFDDKPIGGIVYGQYGIQTITVLKGTQMITFTATKDCVIIQKLNDSTPGGTEGDNNNKHHDEHHEHHIDWTPWIILALIFIFTLFVFKRGY